MLKWLVTRGPTTAQTPREVVTDDPFATLPVNTKTNTSHIYAVSRVNPLYHDEEVEITASTEGDPDDEAEVPVSDVIKEENPPESPPTDRGSVRSSGYGSKETDSVSDRSDTHEDDEILGMEVEEALRTTTAFGDAQGRLATNENASPLNLINKSEELNSKKERNVDSLQTVAQVRKPYEDVTKSNKDIPIVLSSKGKPVATIVSQHPQFVRAIEVGIRRARSLETLHKQQHQQVVHNSGASTVPRPIWPRDSPHVTKRDKKGKSLKEHLSKLKGWQKSYPGRVPSPIHIVEQNIQFVTSIDVSPPHSPIRANNMNPSHFANVPDSANIPSENHPSNSKHGVELRYQENHQNPYDFRNDDYNRHPYKKDYRVKRDESYSSSSSSGSGFRFGVRRTSVQDPTFGGEEPSMTRYFGGQHSTSSYPLMSLQPDSLVNEATLKMMRYGQPDDLSEEEDTMASPVQTTAKDGPVPLPDFSQVMYTRGLYATLNRAASLNTKNIVKPPYKTRSKSIDISSTSFKSSAKSVKKRGLTTVKDLWEKSGLKTNGRKLLVDVNDLIDDNVEEHEVVSRKSSIDSDIEQLRSFRSDVAVNAQRSSRLHSDSTNLSSPSHEYPSHSSHKYTSHSSMDTMDTKSSDTYAEIDDIINVKVKDMADGIDNPTFIDDSGQPTFPSPQHHTKHNAPGSRFLDPDKLAEFQKKISEKLQGAPLHRMQWLDLDEIVVETAEDKPERRVKFTPDTYIPNSLERSLKNGHHSRRSPPPLGPGGVVRNSQEEDVEALEGRSLSEVTMNPMNLMATNGGNRKGMWTSAETYQDRFQEAPTGTLSRGRSQQQWESYYGTSGTMDRTLPRHLAPHPNSQAPLCGKSGACHDFTIDMRRAEKLRLRSAAREKRRRGYILLLLFVAFMLFLCIVVAISWYYTGGEKLFGPL